jgi:hypothetical protein
MRRRLPIVFWGLAILLLAAGSAYGLSASQAVQCSSDGAAMSCLSPASVAATVTDTAVAPTTESLTAPWPDASSTGVPAGTALSVYSGPCAITAPTTITAKTITCPEHLLVAAKVTIVNSKVNGGVWLDTDQAGSADWQVTLVNTEVDGTTQQLAAVCCGNATLIGVNAHGGVTAVQCEEGSRGCLIQDSYLHGQYIKPDSNWHLGGFLSDGGGPITITHSTVVCDQQAIYGSDGGCTGDINLIPNFAAAHDVTITGNLLGANVHSAFCTYGGTRDDANGKGPSKNIVYRDNVFQRGSNGICAAYGPVNAFDAAGVGNVWTNNTYEDGTPVSPED